MGTVYLAVDPEADRLVALKILSKEKTENPALVKRFRAEAETAGQLQHENIVSVYEAGEADGYLYIALEYVEGTDVQKLLKKHGRLPLRRTLEIIKQVTRALDHAFRQGIVHRDIKPSNMLIKRNGTVKLADMGLARSVDESLDAGITRLGTTVGTVDYMAPEQAKDSKSADVRSDIYSLGCAWYHMLTGSPPFPKGSITNRLYAHISSPRPDPRDLNPDVPEHIAALVMKMMAKSPRDRYQTPAELLDVLEHVSFQPDAVAKKFLSALEDVVEPAEDEAAEEVAPLLARPRTPPRRTLRWRRWNRLLSRKWREFIRNLVLITAGIAVLSLLWWMFVRLLPGSAP